MPKENNLQPECETHIACQQRLLQEGEKTQCCYCYPHEDCSLNKPPTELKELLEEFDRNFVKEKYNGSDGYLGIVGAYENVRAFISKLRSWSKQSFRTSFYGH